MGPDAENANLSAVRREEYATRYGKENVQAALYWKAGQMKTAPSPAQKKSRGGLKGLIAAVLVLAALFSFGGCINRNGGNGYPPIESTAIIRPINQGVENNQIKFVAGTDARYVRFSVKCNDGVQHGRSQSVTEGQEVVFNLDKPTMFDGTYKIQVFDGTTRGVANNKVFEGEFERTGNPRIDYINSSAIFDGTNVVYNTGTSGRHVRFLIKSSDGREVLLSFGKDVAPNQRIEMNLDQIFGADFQTIYDGTYEKVVRDGPTPQSTPNVLVREQFQREGNPKVIDNRAEFSMTKARVTDAYSNTGKVGVTPTRETRIYFSANKTPDNVNVQLTGDFNTVNQTFSGAQITPTGNTHNGKPEYGITITGMMNGINDTRVNVSATGVTTGNDYVREGSTTVKGSFDAPAIPRIPSAMPGIHDYLNLLPQQNFVRVNLNGSIPREKAQYAQINVSYNTKNHTTGVTGQSNHAPMTLEQWFNSIGQAIPANINHILIPIDSQYNYTGMKVELESLDQGALKGYGSYVEPGDITNGVFDARNYQYILKAVEQRVRSQIQSQLTAPNNVINRLDVIVGSDGLVRANWNRRTSPISNQDFVAEFRIPNVGPNSPIGDWIDNASTIVVPPQPGPTHNPNFNRPTVIDSSASLSLSDAQVLFNHALAQRGGSANQQHLAGAQVVMVRRAMTQGTEALGTHEFRFLVQAISGNIYEVTTVFARRRGSSTFADLVANPNRDAGEFMRSSSHFRQVNELFPVRATTSSVKPLATPAMGESVCQTSASLYAPVVPNATALRNAQNNATTRDFLNNIA